MLNEEKYIKHKSKIIKKSILDDIVDTLSLLFIISILFIMIFSLVIMILHMKEIAKEDTTTEQSIELTTEDIDDCVLIEHDEPIIYAPSMRMMEPDVVALSCVSEREELYHSTIPTMSWFDTDYNDYYWTTIDPYMKTYPIKMQDDNFTIWSDIRTRSGLTESDLTALFDRYYPYLQGY